MGLLWSNFARATVASPPSGTGGLSFSVAAGKGALFPNPGAGEYFYGVFTNSAKSAYEIVKIESRSTDSFTIAASGRGLDGTTAQTWAANDIFYVPMTKVALDEVPFAAANKAIAALTPAADKVPYFTGAAAAALATLTSFGRSLIALADISALASLIGIFTTGDVKLTLKTTADAGWVLMDDKTIGDASSGATGRANADTEALYTLLWNNTTNAWCPVSTGRGASAAADFAAHKTITLPRTLGRALAVAGSGSSLTARALAEYLGTETHTLTTAQIPPHQHSGTTGSENASHDHNLPDVAWRSDGEGLSWVGGTSIFSGTRGGTTYGQNQNHQHAFTTNNDGGSGGSHPNMQPSLFLNVMVKL